MPSREQIHEGGDSTSLLGELQPQARGPRVSCPSPFGLVFNSFGHYELSALDMIFKLAKSQFSST